MDALFLEFQEALGGRYSLDRELGRGGMGVVYLAREVRLDRAVAIKLLPPERAAEASVRERFLQEARLAARLSHPHVIPIHGVYDEGRFVYYVMAAVDGESLAQRVQARGPLGTQDGVRIMREVAWALAHAHAHGLVHRDVKPDNVLIEASTGRALVVDFGIAAAAGTTDGAIRGTPEFMSPEQVLGHATDARSDLYSLGATMYYALTGRLPFRGATATEVMAHQVATPASPVAASGTPVGRHLAQLVDQCLAKDPARRPQGAEQLAEALTGAIARRQELPAALRAFVKRGSRADGVGALAGLVGSLAFASKLATSLAAMTGAGSFGVFLAIGAGSVAMLASGWMMYAAGKLRRHGFVHADLVPAFAAELASGREERAVDHGGAARGTERLLKWGMVWSWVTVAGGISAAIWPMLIPWMENAGSVGSTAMIPALLSSLGYVALRGQRQDIDTEFWAKLWVGRAGRAAFAAAARLVPLPAGARAMTHRATELVLGLAAEDLFARLPAALRQSVGDVPGTVARLQAQATDLRARLDLLQGAGSQAIGPTLDTRREALASRLEQTVATLSGIRLELLRLSVGRGGPEGLTTQLDMAAEVSDQVRRLLEARDEVDRALVDRTRPAIAG